MNVRREEAVGFTRAGVELIDRPIYAVIEQRRRADDLDERRDILSLLLQARTEEGEELTDYEIRYELLTLVLAGHETTANSLAWAWERLVRNPRGAGARWSSRSARARGAGAEAIEATIIETMRSRPVVPIVGRRAMLPWRLGEYGVRADTPVLISILLLHHREDLYEDPFEFRPERWADRKPGTYEWIPFGGGIRRCLGAALAMAEQRVVLEATARRLDLEADEPEPERALHRNVTMIPARGGRVVARSQARGRPLSRAPVRACLAHSALRSVRIPAWRGDRERPSRIQTRALAAGRPQARGLHLLRRRVPAAHPPAGAAPLPRPDRRALRRDRVGPAASGSSAPPGVGAPCSGCRRGLVDEAWHEFILDSVSYTRVLQRGLRRVPPSHARRDDVDADGRTRSPTRFAASGPLRRGSRKGIGARGTSTSASASPSRSASTASR